VAGCWSLGDTGRDGTVAPDEGKVLGLVAEGASGTFCGCGPLGNFS
jgi:hypothetical protein